MYLSALFKSGLGKNGFLTKTIRIMKLTIVLLIAACLQVSAKGYSQKITIKENNIPLQKVFEEIRKQTGYQFFYVDEVLVNAKNVTINVKKGSIDEVLDSCFKNQELTYTISERTIIVKRKIIVQDVTTPLPPLIAFEIKGKITDDKGQPLEGATILIKGANNGTKSDANGNFSINAAPNSTLVISYVGFETAEVKIGNQAYISVQLKPSVGIGEQVVVVGYGTQKKTNLTGSISSVSSKTLLERPAPNAGNLLEGRITGLRVTQPTGQPGRDNAVLQIRGLGSFGASSTPLVLVDGVTESLDNLSPDDIDNVTVLKDAASASIYGVRAANGVILVTTKKGRKGQSQVNYKVDFGLQTATRLPDFIKNSVEFMQMWNVARARSGETPVYTQDQIDAYKNATDITRFPNFNWEDYYFKQATAINHHLGFSGGNDKTSYNFSLGYLNQDGILPSHSFQRYNALLNFDTRVNDFITIGTSFNMVYKNIFEPWLTNDDIVLLVYQAGPTFAPYLPDGSGRFAARAYNTEGHNASPTSVFNNDGQYTRYYNVNAQAYADINLYKGLLWEVKGAFKYEDNAYKNHQHTVPAYLFQPDSNGIYEYDNDGYPSVLGVVQQDTRSVLQTFYSTLTYDTKIGSNHNLKAMLGYEQQSYKDEYLYGHRATFPTPELSELDAGSSDGQSTAGSSIEWATKSVFGRLNYDYKGKYLLEANARYDGTSRVAATNRWGLFPSVSTGWRVSEEKFVKNRFSWVNNLKLRASLGTLGNQNIGAYPYQDILSTVSYPLGASLSQGAILRRLTDKNLKWESTRIIDFGADMDIYKGLLGITVDWFKKNTFDILTSQPVPGSLGLSGPVTNDGKLQNIGWELELRHANTIGQFHYSANFLFSTERNKLLHIRTETKGVQQVGLPYNSYYMYEWIGIFQSQEEIDHSPTQTFYPPKPGDLKIKDQNKDGVVDADDRVVVKGAYPDYTYSFSLNIGWKGFNLSTFFQGVKGLKLRVDGWGIDPFDQGTPPTTKFWNAWTPDNHSNTVPAIYESGYQGVSAYNSTYYLQDASYLRLKNINLSYIFSKAILNKIKLKGLVLYVSGDNLFTITKYEGADPERLEGNGRYAQYPQLRTLNAGLNVNF